MHNLTHLKEWQALVEHQHEIADQHMRDWFARDPDRYSHFKLSCGGILLDYSRNRITDKTIQLFCDLADAIQLPQKIEALFTGKPINNTENRPALHTALRDKSSHIFVNGEDVSLLIWKTQERMRTLVTQIHAQQWRGVTGKAIKHIVNIGIGGSYTGPMMCTYALKEYATTDLQFHFISSVDKSHLDEVLQRIDPEITLFIISSKSFTTIETLTNVNTILAWMKNKFGDAVIGSHFIAITAAADKARELGIPEEHIFPLWDWVGGRYSIWSAIGLPLMLMLGNDYFTEFLAGAYEIDQHFRSASFNENLPVLMAMLGIWYSNFFGATAQGIVPYPHRLRYFIPYLQQADMESNGKSIGLGGNELPYTTAPVLFGEEGVIGQHTYHQLLHQGKHLIPVDFILANKSPLAPLFQRGEFNASIPTFDKGGSPDTHHDILIASALSQAQALMCGKTYAEAYGELIAAKYSEQKAAEIARHKLIPGNRPSNILLLAGITPKNLGALIALYEHKIFVQGAVWGINSFDQWGVELGKQLLPDILKYIQNDKNSGNFEHYFQKNQS